MSIEAFYVAMLYYNIVPIAPVSTMYLLHYARQHGIDIPKTATQIYPVMELPASVNRIFPIAISRILFQII
jgi:hypothetical protein